MFEKAARGHEVGLVAWSMKVRSILAILEIIFKIPINLPTFCIILISIVFTLLNQPTTPCYCQFHAPDNLNGSTALAHAQHEHVIIFDIRKFSAYFHVCKYGLYFDICSQKNVVDVITM